jgi:hypothetical protein
MKKIIQIKLLNSLIQLDFLLLNKDLFKSSYTNTNQIDFELKHQKMSLLTFDIFYMLKDLKQFIRILQKIKTHEEKSQLYILTSNQQYSDLINFFLSKFVKIKIKIKSLFFKEDFKKNLLQSIIFIDNNFNFNYNMFQFLMHNKVFLMSKINTKVFFNLSGTYNICTNLKDFNKFIFIVCLLRQILIFNKN